MAAMVRSARGEKRRRERIRAVRQPRAMASIPPR